VKLQSTKLTEILHTLWTEFWNIRLEIIEGHLQYILELFTSMFNIYVRWNKPFSTATVT
jgi:hypothetical protein